MVAALLGTLFSAVVRDISLFNGISIALIVYIVSYYVYKALFVTKVEKPSKILSTGIGAYFLTWIVMLALFITLLSPNLTITSPAPNSVFSAGQTVTIVAKITNQLGTPFSGANVTTKSPSGELIQLNPDPTLSGTYSATYNITSANPGGEWRIVVDALINGRRREDSVTVNIQTSS